MSLRMHGKACGGEGSLVEAGSLLRMRDPPGSGAMLRAAALALADVYLAAKRKEATAKVCS